MKGYKDMIQAAVVDREVETRTRKVREGRG
jgi:hypothetical protein